MRKLIVYILIIAALSVCASAESVSDIFDTDTAVKAVPKEVRDVTGEIAAGEVYDTEGAISRLWSRFTDTVTDGLKERLSESLVIIAVIMLNSVCSAVCSGQKAAECVDIVSVCALCGLLAGRMDSLMTQATDAVNTLVGYSEVSLPILFGTAAIAAPAGSAARYAAACMGIDILLELSRTIIIPLIYAYTALVCAGCLFENNMLSSLVKVAKWSAVTVMTAVCIIFTIYLSVTGIVTGSVDAAAVKAVKTGISTLLPVVGGIISDASAAVLAAAGTVRASLGALGLICVCAVCAAPFAALGVSLLIYKACAAVAQAFPCRRAGKLLDGMGTAVSMQLGLLGSFGVMIFISIMSGLKVVGL